jgi:uncharacterized protein
MVDANRADAVSPHVHVITLGVSDLERSLAFYRDGLGFPSDGIIGTEHPGDDVNPAGAAVRFELEGGIFLMCYPRVELAKDAGVEPGATAGSGHSLGHIVESRIEVDRVLELARVAGGRIPGPARERAWRIYSGYFADPDAHLWEVICLLGEN